MLELLSEGLMNTLQLDIIIENEGEIGREMFAPRFIDAPPNKYTVKYSEDMTKCWVTVIEK